MLEEKDKAKYYIERIRAIGNTTTTWSLVFLFSLIYTGLTSIYPKFSKVHNVISLENKVKYLKNVEGKLQNKRDTAIYEIQDTLRKYAYSEIAVVDTFISNLKN